MSARFSHVKYDDEAVQLQNKLKKMFEEIEAVPLKPGRSHSLMLTALEEAYMWAGKAIRDEQIARNGNADEQPERKNG